MHLFLLIVASLISISSQENQNIDWDGKISANGKHLIKIIYGNETTSFEEYREECQQFGADLVFTKTQEKYDALIDLMANLTYGVQGVYFIGAKRVTSNTDEWEWLDGEPVSNFTAWMEGSPNNGEGIEHYMSICVRNTSDGWITGWEDIAATPRFEYGLQKYFVRRGAICAKKEVEETVTDGPITVKQYETTTPSESEMTQPTSQSAPNIGKFIWDGAFGDIFIKVLLNEEETSFDEYRAECQKMGAHLAFTKTQEEYDAVINILHRVQNNTEGLYFLGAQRTSLTSSEWKWLDGELLQGFTAWVQNAPNNGAGVVGGNNENCLAVMVRITKEGISAGWEDISEEKHYEPGMPFYHRRGAICARKFEWS